MEDSGAHQENGNIKASEGWRRVAALMVAAACGFFLLRANLPTAFSPIEGQWDFETYYFATKLYDAGGNPWDHPELVKSADRALHHFIYPHHTFAFFRLFGQDSLESAKDAYLISKLGCIAALILLWATAFIRAGARGWFLAFASIGYSAAICRDLVVGNVSIFEQTLIWFGIFALLRQRLWLFCVLIIAAGQFKLFPLLLISLVLLTSHPHRWRYFAGSIIAVGLNAAGVYLLDPVASKTLTSLILEMGSFEPGGQMHPCSLALFREWAGSVMERWPQYGRHVVGYVGVGVYAVYATIILFTFALLTRGRMSLRHAVFIGLLTYGLIAPRMKDYSYILLIVPTFEIFRSRLLEPGSKRTWMLLAAIALTLPEFDVFWDYRSLLLAFWVWVISFKSPDVSHLGELSGSDSPPEGMPPGSGQSRAD